MLERFLQASSTFCMGAAVVVLIFAGISALLGVASELRLIETQLAAVNLFLLALYTRER